MIKYQLQCDYEHLFEGWFPSIKEFERQKKKHLIICPLCDSSKVDRAIMAPNIKSSDKKTNQILDKKLEKFRERAVGDEMMLASQAKSVMRRIRKYIEKDFENVGDKFYEEAKKAESGERDNKIYGTPTQEQVNDLLDEGIDLFHVPTIKDN